VVSLSGSSSRYLRPPSILAPVREQVRTPAMFAEVTRSDGQLPRGARVAVVPGRRLRLQFVRPPGAPPEPPVDVPLADVTSLVCTSRGWWDLAGCHLTLTGRRQDGITLAVRPRENPWTLLRLVRALLAGLPDDALVDVAPWYRRPVRRTPGLVPAVVTALLVVLCAGGVVIGFALGVRHEAETAAPRDGVSPPGAVAEPPEAVAEPSGYRRLRGAGGNAPAVGAPWGGRCLPLLFVVPGRVPPDVLTSMDGTLREAGLAFTLQAPAMRFHAGSGAGADDRTARVTVFPAGAAPAPPAGAAADAVAHWQTLGSGAGTRLDRIQGHLSMAAANETLRKELRLLVAHAAGIAHSDRPGSGIRADPRDSIDGFSSEDLEALRRFSGCDP
jgi:hypothetical protein